MSKQSEDFQQKIPLTSEAVARTKKKKRRQLLVNRMNKATPYISVIMSEHF